jgi:cysteine desulfuration protein SufE
MAHTETIAEAIAEIVEEFEDLEEWPERFKYIIELARELDDLPPEYHTDEYKVDGCVSQVWLHAFSKGDRLFFEADSDAVIVKGLIALLIRVYSGRTPGEILATPPDFLQETGLNTHLSPNRTNGLLAMVNRIMASAREHQGG